MNNVAYLLDLPSEIVEQLTPKQQETIKLLRSGISQTEIAKSEYVSCGAIYNRILNIKKSVEKIRRYSPGNIYGDYKIIRVLSQRIIECQCIKCGATVKVQALHLKPNFRCDHLLREKSRHVNSKMEINLQEDKNNDNGLTKYSIDYLVEGDEKHVKTINVLGYGKQNAIDKLKKIYGNLKIEIVSVLSQV